MLLLLPSVVWAIADGVPDAEDSAVVGIVDGVTSAECTGTLIAPDVVLTARHCVSEIVGYGCDATWGATHEPQRFYITTGAGHTYNVSDYHTVSSVVVDDARPDLCGGDVAILVLAEPVAGDEAEPLDPRVDEAIVADETYAAVGYGATDDSGTGTGTRRRRDGLVATCVGDCTGSGAATGEWIGEAGVCVGDSGGPALDASGHVVGVASRGGVGCVFPVYASLASDGWADFLREAVAEAAVSGGYTAPEWAAAAPDGGDSGDTGIGDSGIADTSAPDGDGGGCGCGSASGAPAIAAIVMAGLAARRRREPLG